MTTRAFAGFMVTFTVGLIAADWLWGGAGRVSEMLALRVAMAVGAVVLWWIVKRLRSKRAKADIGIRGSTLPVTRGRPV